MAEVVHLLVHSPANHNSLVGQAEAGSLTGSPAHVAGAWLLITASQLAVEEPGQDIDPDPARPLGMHLVAFKHLPSCVGLTGGPAGRGRRMLCFLGVVETRYNQLLRDLPLHLCLSQPMPLMSNRKQGD